MFQRSGPVSALGTGVLGSPTRPNQRTTTAWRQPGCITARIAQTCRAPFSLEHMSSLKFLRKRAWSGLPRPPRLLLGASTSLRGQRLGTDMGQVSAGPSRVDCHPRTVVPVKPFLLWAPSVLVRGSSHPRVWPPQPTQIPCSLRYLFCRFVLGNSSAQHLCIKAEASPCCSSCPVLNAAADAMGLAKSNCISCQDVSFL